MCVKMVQGIHSFRLIHISSSCVLAWFILARVTWQFFVRLILLSNGNCPLDWNSKSMFYANPLLQKIFNLIWIIFSKMVKALGAARTRSLGHAQCSREDMRENETMKKDKSRGSSGSDGWARVMRERTYSRECLLWKKMKQSAARALDGWARVNLCVQQGSFVLTRVSRQLSFVWSYSRMWTVHWITIWIQCSLHIHCFKNIQFDMNYIWKNTEGPSGVLRKFSWGVSFSGIWWPFVCGVRFLWLHNLTPYSFVQTNFLAKFVDIYAYSSTPTPLILCVIAPNINYQRSKVGYRRKLNSVLRQRSS